MTAPSEPVAETLFDGNDIRVVKEIFPGCPIVAITFTGRAPKPPVKAGFGELHLRKRRISAIHFLSKANHWWQTPELGRTLDMLLKQGHLPAGAERITYGSSMGGYAALICSRKLDASRVIVYSPQYSINRKKVPFEERWQNYAAKVVFKWDDLAGGLSPAARVQVICDPFFTPDMKHIALLEKHRTVERIPIPFAGHNTARLLHEMKLTASFTDELLTDTFDPKAFFATYKGTRDQCSLFWHGLGWTLEQHSRTAAAALASTVAYEMARKGGRITDATLLSDMRHSAFHAAIDYDDTERAEAVLADLEADQPGQHRTLLAAGLVARAKGLFDIYRQKARAASAQKTHQPEYFFAEIDALLLAKDAAAARKLMNTIRAPFKQVPQYLLTEARLKHAEKQFDEARELARAYCRSAPRSVEARILLARCWMDSGRPDIVRGQLTPAIEHPVASLSKANEIGRLLTSAGSAKDASKLAARTAATRERYRAVTATFAALDWSDLEAAARKLRAAARTGPAAEAPAAQPAAQQASN